MSRDLDPSIGAALDNGRLQGYAHVLHLRRYPLASAPRNPYLSISDKTAAAWQQSFNETVNKHTKENK